MYQRILALSLQAKASAFILGPRQTGKTTLIEQSKVSLSYNLLSSTEFIRLNRDPEIVFNECSKLSKSKQHYVWIDEVQKIPALLDTVHQTIEKYKNIHFILSGSSARKLRKYGVNLLGGRALDLRLYNLTIEELGKDYNLDLALNFGTLPKIYSLLIDQQAELAKDLLYSYLTTYLDEEIKKEALVKDLQPFQRFLEVAAQSIATTVNFSKISDDSLISDTAVKNYFSILEDTLIGFLLPGYHLSTRKQLTKHPKFYLFDNGVTRAITGSLNSPASGLEKGALFEQFVIQEIRRLNDYYKKRFKLFFWLTESGAEVDLLITKGKEILLAVECKASKTINKRDLSGLKAFKKDFPKVKCYICAPVEREIEIDKGFSAINLNKLVEVFKKL